MTGKSSYLFKKAEVFFCLSVSLSLSLSLSMSLEAGNLSEGWRLSSEGG